MVGRLYWASCARATGIDALLRRSPPPRRAAAYIRRQQAGGFWRATDYIRQAVVGTDVMLRRSPRVVLPQISGNSRPADFGGRLSILGGDKPCVGSGHRCSAAPLSPRVVLLPISAAAVWRLSAGSQLYRTNRARAVGTDVLPRRSPCIVLLPIYGDSDPTVAPYTVHYR